MTELPELCAHSGLGVYRAGGKILRDPGAGVAAGRCVGGAACVALTLAGTGSCQRPAAVYFPSWARVWGSWTWPGSSGAWPAAQEACRKELERVEAEKAGRLRCYRALGLCAGAALAILLL